MTRKRRKTIGGSMFALGIVLIVSGASEHFEFWHASMKITGFLLTSIFPR